MILDKIRSPTRTVRWSCGEDVGVADHKTCEKQHVDRKLRLPFCSTVCSSNNALRLDECAQKVKIHLAVVVSGRRMVKTEGWTSRRNATVSIVTLFPPFRPTATPKQAQLWQNGSASQIQVVVRSEMGAAMRRYCLGRVPHCFASQAVSVFALSATSRLRRWRDQPNSR
ncbi:hypothetical protein CC80DRAFT_251730 [Byssothecium circinans]|uniref:Uncharacterized protein n=1 Tax=Byssothecium circinans TaxID=147558 RepID=A0A6A5TCB0_9PLEO|nr:hypothetical protein CC80DRAFT_251730 [Byssothecium circinans]